MSQWIDRIKSHPIWNELNEIRAVAKQAIGADQPQEVQSELERLAAGESYIRRSVSAIDPVLIVPQMLNSVASPLSNLLSEFNAFQENENPQHLANANNHMDEALLAVGSIPRSISGSAESDAVASISEVRTASESALAAVGKRRQHLASEYGQLKSQVDTLAPIIAEQKQRLDTAISTNQSQFSDAQDHRLREFEAQRKTLSEMAAKFEKELDDKSEQVIVEIVEMRDKAQELLHIIGNTGMAGEYAKTANYSRTAALCWQATTAASLIVLAGFAFYSYLGISSSDVNIAQTLGRVFVMATLGIVAAYASRQADHFQKNELGNRRYQLILSSIDPYLASLKVEERSRVKEKLATELFGHPAASAAVGDDATFNGNAADLIKLLTSLLAAAKGKV